MKYDPLTPSSTSCLSGFDLNIALTSFALINIDEFDKTLRRVSSSVLHYALQSQCKLSAESLLFAEVQPDFAVFMGKDSQKSRDDKENQEESSKNQKYLSIFF